MTKKNLGYLFKSKNSMYIHKTILSRSLVMIMGIILLGVSLNAQLRPGFNLIECREMALIGVRTARNEVYAEAFSEPSQFVMRYQIPSPVGFDNSWDLWENGNGTAVVSLRGTSLNAESWLENMYAAMVPAKATITLPGGGRFDYELAEHPSAGVHVGWLTGVAFLAQDIRPKLDSLIASGVRDIIITGHSQGGALAILLTAWLYGEQRSGDLPGDIRIKTYAMAAPKPGNLFFAYEYEQRTQQGWAFNVVNPFDWVPQVPVTIQTLDDYTATNPFVTSDGAIRSRSTSERAILRNVYKKLDRPTRKAQRTYQRFLGDHTSTLLQRQVPGLVVPKFIPCNNYVRTGTQVVLRPDEAYVRKFPERSDDVFLHHLHAPYLILMETFESSQTAGFPGLPGNWELVSCAGARLPLSELYANRVPTLRISQGEERISGSTGCNAFTGTARWNRSDFTMHEPLAITKRFCPGEGENVFLEALRSVDGWRLDDEFLVLHSSGLEVMRFRPAQ